MSKVDKPRPAGARLVDVVRVLVTVVLGGIGAAAGFKHTHDWAVHHGQAGWLAWADAVVIEGMAIVAGFEVRRDHHHGNTRLVSFPMAVLVAAFGIQMAAQVALAEPTPAGWLLAAMPALGFLVVVKLLLRRAPLDPHLAPPEQPTAAEPVEVTAPTPTVTPTEPAHIAAEPAPTEPAPVPAPAAAPPSASAPAPAAEPVKVLGKLPVSLRDAVTALATSAHEQGRPVTAEEITQRVALPDPMVTALVDELNTRVNGHPVTT